MLWLQTSSPGHSILDWSQVIGISLAVINKGQITDGSFELVRVQLNMQGEQRDFISHLLGGHPALALQLKIPTGRVILPTYTS